LIADIRGRPDPERRTWTHRKRDGSLIDVRATAMEVTFQGRDARVVVATDVTSQLRAESALREGEQRYHDLFENGGEPIATVDLTGVITEVNRAFELMLASPAVS
jgi:PAS domain-containing protein